MPSRRDRWLAALPAVLLVMLATGQIQLTRSQHLSPWKGGGFGMFSTTDVAAHRHLRVYLRRESAALEVSLPASLGAEALRARLLPTERRLRSLALRIAQVLEPQHGPVTGVRLEVWRRRFESPGLDPHPTLLRQLEVALGDAD